MPKSSPGPTPGPWGWENARAQASGQASVGTLEVSCYVDRYHLYLDQRAGPYRIVSLTQGPGVEPLEVTYGRVRLALLVRVDQFIPSEFPDEYVDPRGDRTTSQSDMAETPGKKSPHYSP